MRSKNIHNQNIFNRMNLKDEREIVKKINQMKQQDVGRFVSHSIQPYFTYSDYDWNTALSSKDATDIPSIDCSSRPDKSYWLLVFLDSRVNDFNWGLSSKVSDFFMGRYGYSVTWADQATIIYSMYSLARAAGGVPHQWFRHASIDWTSHQIWQGKMKARYKFEKRKRFPLWKDVNYN